MAFGRPAVELGSRPQVAPPGQQVAAPSRPGQAQSQQSPWSTSTAYNPQQSQPFSAWSPQQAPSRPATPTYDPNIANSHQANRPPAFQSRSVNFDGTQSQTPDYARRDAMISQINDQLGQMQSQSWDRPVGAPQFDFSQMWDKAGTMVQQGWQNPFSQQQTGQQQLFQQNQPQPQQQDQAAAIRNLLQGYNVPQNVMDQLAGMFGGQQTSQPPATGVSSPGQASPIQDSYANSSPYSSQFANREMWQQKWAAGAKKYLEQLAPSHRPAMETHLAKFQNDFQRLLGHYQESELVDVWKKARQGDFGNQSSEIQELLSHANTYGIIDPAIVSQYGSWARKKDEDDRRESDFKSRQLGAAQEAAKTLPKKDKYGQYERPLTFKEAQAVKFLEQYQRDWEKQKNSGATKQKAAAKAQDEVAAGFAAWQSRPQEPPFYTAMSPVAVAY